MANAKRAGGGETAQGLARMSMERLLEVGTSAAGRQRQQMHDIGQLMQAVRHAKEAFNAKPPAAADSDLPLKRLVLDTDQACYRFQTLDAVSLAAAQQARPFCLELASVLEQHREEMQEFVAGLIALLCRTIHNQEVFSDLLLKAHRDVSIARRREAECQQEAKEAAANLLAAQREAASQLAELEKTVADQQEEATRLELEASRPLWEWRDAAADPRSSVPSQQWYEAELAYLQNKSSELQACNEMLSTQKDKDVERALIAEKRALLLERDNAEQRRLVVAMQSDKEFEENSTQTEPDMEILVHTILPNLIARGGTGPSPPYSLKFKLRHFGSATTGARLYDLELPEHFKLIYEDYQDSAMPKAVDTAKQDNGTQEKKHHMLKLKSRSFKASPFRSIVNNISDDTSVVLTLRAVTRWIDEIWAARVLSAYKDGFDKLNMDPVDGCGDTFGSYIWDHFVKKYGTVHEASIHVGDFVRSLREHRDTSHRVRVFSEFAGIDLRRPQKALSLHIIVTHQIFKSLRPDNDNGVVWCPLPLAERGAYILINTKLKGSPTRGHENGGAGSTENEAVTTFFSQTLPELAVKDPSSKKQAEEYVVDSDLFAEAMLGLLMAEDNANLEHVIDVMCERAEREPAISLPRFISIMGLLNAKLEDEFLMEEFEKLVAKNDNKELNYDELLFFVRQHPLDGSEKENKVLEAKNAPSFALLQAAIDRFWYAQARRMRRTLQDLRTKERRMTRIFEKFGASLRNLEKELSHGRLEILPELWVYARMMMGEALASRAEEHRERLTKPKASFFRSKTRKLHIMRALLPRSIKY